MDEQPQTSTSPSPHGTRLLRILVLLVFALLIAVVSSLTTYYFLNRQYQSQTQTYQQLAPEVVPTSIPSPSPAQAQDETANWKTYTSTYLSFKYPTIWQTGNKYGDKTSGFADSISLFTLPRTQGIELATAILNVYDKNITTNDYIQQHKNDILKLLNLRIGEKLQIVGTLYTRIQNNTVDGLSVQVYDGVAVPNYPAEVMPYEKRVIAVKNNFLYNFASFPSSGNINDPNVQLFNTLLSTFKFTQ